MIWSLFAPTTLALPVAFFFVGCVLVAGIYGGLTANRRILFIQALPALVTMIVLWVT